MSSVVSEPLDLVRLSLDERIVVSRPIPARAYPAAPGLSAPLPARSSSEGTATFGASCMLTIST
jgi:hypothetical protein